MDKLPVQLVSATRAHALQIMPWFSTHHDCTVWGGPQFRFPFTIESFLVDSKLETVPSYALIQASTEICGFGQFYPRAGRCHLGRLAIAPGLRGRGLGTRLIEMLLSEGTRQLGVTQSSLFVHVTNTAAMALYERLGFTRAPYPEKGLGLPNSHYMVAG
jgi:ribosomal protein S18 acetylase RimI-like enzyme